jgi:RNA polymerase sigma-70 factor, ECF subfamily
MASNRVMAPENHAEAATALVERAKRGDQAAFGELVRRYRDRIVALALHLTGSDTEAEDITQEVFLKAYLKLGEFEGRSHFFTWVYRMAINRSLNARRDQGRRRETPMADPRVDRALAVDAPGDPARAAELRQTYARLLTALDGLPAPMRTSVVLVVLQGMSHGEAAVVQSCSPGTIAWRIHEARARLRKAMEPARASERPLSADLTRLLREWVLPIPSPS